MENVHGCDDECGDIHFLDDQNSNMNSTDLTSAKLVDEQEEIFNVDKIRWEKHSWKHLSLICGETVINLQRVLARKNRMDHH